MSQIGLPADEDAMRLSGRQWLLLFILAAVQFMHMVDFMIVMPLAPQLEADLGISTRQFGHVVSAYAGAACVAGLLLASFLDRFDRKRSLLGLFGGFTLGTLLCAFAPNYELLLVGRAIAGAFGGVAAAAVLAIVGDAYPDRRRGLATGVVMSSFSVASIVGVPAGLLLAASPGFGWRAPFLILAAASGVVWLIACLAAPPLRGHLGAAHSRPGLWEVASRPAHLKAYGLMLSLVFSGFLVFPFLPVYLVKNVGVAEKQLWLVYFLGGLATLVSMNVVGRLADRFPRLLLFRVLALVALGPIVIVTRLPHGTPLAVVLAVTTLIMILNSGRMVPATAMVTGAAAPHYRGTFLSINTSVQQLGAFLAPFLASFFLDDSGKQLEGFATVGLLCVAVAGLGIVVAGLVRPAEEPETVASAVPADEGEPDPIAGQAAEVGLCREQPESVS
jgi:predicted MFS family arabinose efflux permease